MRTLSRVLYSLLLALCLNAAQARDLDPDPLKVALLPDEDAATIIQRNQPLEDYLEAALEREVDLVVTTDYSSMIEAVRFGRVHVAYFGPLSYTLAKSRSEIEPFAARIRGGQTTYQAVLIGNIEQGIESLADAVGQDVAFGDIASTSSHLIPKSMLRSAGLTEGEDYRENFLGAHDAVALAVQRGNAAVGGLSKPIFNDLVARGLISLDEVRVLAESAPFPQYPWTLRMDLAPELKAAIRDAFLEMDDEDVLEAFKAEGFAPISDADYDVVRQLQEELGL